MFSLQLKTIVLNILIFLKLFSTHSLLYNPCTRLSILIPESHLLISAEGKKKKKKKKRLFSEVNEHDEAPKQVSASDKRFFLLGDRWLQVARAAMSFQDGTSTYKQIPKVPRTQNNTKGSGSSGRADSHRRLALSCWAPGAVSALSLRTSDPKHFTGKGSAFHC